MSRLLCSRCLPNRGSLYLTQDSINVTYMAMRIGVPSAITAVAVSQYFGDRCITIAGGTTEVQKNIIATRDLGV